MLDNKQRAHDLAVALTVESCRWKTEHQVCDEDNGKIIVDPMPVYLDIYQQVLNALDWDFPNGM